LATEVDEDHAVRQGKGCTPSCCTGYDGHADALIERWVDRVYLEEFMGDLDEMYGDGTLSGE
jgi:hypothetical protein